MRLPGFHLSTGITVAYLGAFVIVPLASLVVLASGDGFGAFWDAATAPRVVASYKLSLLASTSAALINVVLGLVLAWTLVRHRFPGRRVVDACIDIPFALPTAVAGIALTALYADTGWFGAPLAAAGLKVAYTPVGIVIAMVFVGLPFVVRSVEPVLAHLDPEIQDAAITLGASKLTTLRRVILPLLTPAILSGFALSLARALGEYGSVVFIAGNIPLRTEIPALLIVSRLDEFDYKGAAAIAVALLGMSVVLFLSINAWQHRVHLRTR